MTLAYYNEIDPFAAQWLRKLIAAGHIAQGDVDERSIVDVRPADLRGYTQCHFFAGIGGWSLAARLAGWPDDKPLWTGSCPCQPFSAAGKRKGTADERHLWPEFFRLIDAERPAVVAGEQVASKDGLGWLDGVCADLEAADYAVWAGDFCAASVGAPHIRQRLWWLGHADDAGSQGLDERRDGADQRAARAPSVAGGLADTRGEPGRQIAGSASRHEEADGRAGWLELEPHGHNRPSSPGEDRDRMADSTGAGSFPGAQPGVRGREEGAGSRHGELERRGDIGFWSRYELVSCRDGTARRIEPGVFPLAHGVSGRVGRLRAYGNAIVPQVAAEILRAYLEGMNP